ncbi:Alpha-L-rhamnosidase N-terminal domain-containing protein [Pedobacter westerhofensis]|uniref:alpha-L-rhamnosidase n=1 Tax=Pedobacter westerhofensis TaxID=425512 RepID=A0A521ALU0_9SPHI|nr:family 78 glycoside hydrolase catalytic domain [Pedobacter westerhofensis]SMO35620.1 Alpha-L-rhamnosidase N-terminal domain-containing protein [Pedobacter westerhofensis]
MRLFALFLLFFATIVRADAQSPRPVNPRCEQQVNPMGIDASSPRLSWEIESKQRNTLQKAYRILVSDDPKLLKSNTGNIWDSKKVNSSASIQVSYKGKPLTAAKTYYWKIMLWDNHGKSSAWSDTQQWQMGLLTKADWKNAIWIAHEVMPDSTRILPSAIGKRDKTGGTINDVLPLIRKEISISKKIKNATIFISGLGHFDLSINGKKIGDHFLDPGWTNYEKQALYVPFDVTESLKNGKNAIGVMLGNGFYYIPKQKKRYRKLLVQYGFPKMICRLLINYTDGSSENIVSDRSWKSAAGPIIFSSIYGGEDYDAAKEQKDWDQPAFDDTQWQNAVITTGPPLLNSQKAASVKIFENFKPQQITQISSAGWSYDLGQNASGIVRISVKGKKGDTIRITPAELINPDHTANQKASGKPYYFTYILKGEGVETWQPRFSYYGFRYLQIDGAVPVTENSATDQLPVITEVTGLQVRNAAEQAGTFNSSSNLFNKTAKLIDWGVKSNMMSVFTDCPHREKLGWLEQLHLMGSSLRYTWQVENLLNKSIEDMRLSQTGTGLVPEISPEYTVFTWGGDMFRDSPEWGSSSIILPWYMYQWYGDRQGLVTAYPMMKKYAAYLKTKAKDNILSQGLGDWYDLGPQPPGVSQLTTMGVTATAIYYYDLDILQQTALTLGKKADAEVYKKLAAEVKHAFNRKFFDSTTNNYATGSQTANAMAIYMKLVPPARKAAVLDNIVADIRKHKNSLTSGDIGYRYLLRVLEQEGRSDVIYEMNSNPDVPGYGYQLAQGATALTESWQALPSASNNHLMLGHLMEWFYSGLGGIRQEENSLAFKQIKIHPEMVEGVTHAETSYLSPYGRIGTSWKKEATALTLTVEIPANTTASVYIPVSKGRQIREGGKALSPAPLKNGKDFAVVKTGSGTYHFTVQ